MNNQFERRVASRILFKYIMCTNCGWDLKLVENVGLKEREKKILCPYRTTTEFVISITKIIYQTTVYVKAAVLRQFR